MCQPSSPVSASLAARRKRSGCDGLDRLEVEGLAGARIERAQLRQHLAQILVVDAAAAAQLSELARGHQVEIVEQGLHRGIQAIALGELRAETLGDGAGEQAGRLDLAQPGPHRLDHVEADAARLGDSRRIEAAVARLVEALGELQRNASLGCIGEHQLDLLQHMDGERARPLGDEIERAGGVVALADAARCTVAAAVGMLARPALVGLGQGRRGGGQCLGGIGRRIEDGCVLLGDRAVVGRALGEQGVLFEFLLDVGGELEMRELQQLDGLLKLRRHCQGLARSQDETRTDTHVPPP